MSIIPMISENFSHIQGNIIGGFNKDLQDFIFLKFKSTIAGRAWIAEMSGPDSEASLVQSSSQQVLKFNGEFKNLSLQGLRAEDFLATAWNNIALTHAGLKALGVPTTDLDAFPDDFKQGMAARASRIGDVGASAPAHWLAPFAPGTEIHAIVIVAADTDELLSDRIEALKSPAFLAGVDVVGTVSGRALSGSMKGHEHFGFKDGVSQPGLRGVNLPDDPVGNPNQGHPGQDLLWPGEFVLGYPTQIPRAKAAFDGPNPDPGPVSTSGPAWTRNGSYLVFRRLDQDVPKFQVQIAEGAAQAKMSTDVFGAKLVGRYESGCPLEARAFQALAPAAAPPSSDPGIAQPILADDDSLNLNFEFGDDAAGVRVPLASHIRKAYPRDEDTGHGDDSESETQTHRLLRRGIAFGGAVGDPVGGGADDARGLLFLCYQKSIAKQFEFVQQNWCNNADFPPKPEGRPAPGQDPIIAQSPSGPFHLDAQTGTIQAQHFVTTSGGEYFFQPSIEALRKIGAGMVGAPTVKAQA